MHHNKVMTKGGSRKRRGGSSAVSTTPNYSDSASFMLATAGTGEQQWNNTFSQQSSLNGNGNTLVGLQGQKAGRRMRHRKGGNFSGLVNEAIVPLSLMGLQHTYRKKLNKRGGKTRKHRNSRKSRKSRKH